MSPERPLAEKNCTRGEYFTISNDIFNFNFLSLVVSEILGGPKFTLKGPFTLGSAAPPRCPLAEKFVYPNGVLYSM